MSKASSIEMILHSRAALPSPQTKALTLREQAAEGGCGVIGAACSEKIAGQHLLQALIQMRNRGNGKGGGVALVGLDPAEYGVTPALMTEDYILAIAYLDPACRTEVESRHIESIFEIDHARVAPHLEDFTALPGLDVKPPEVIQYFVRVKESVYQAFREDYGFNFTRRQIEDEIVYQNSIRLNTEFYASTGVTRAFVLSHGKDLLVYKMVGYGDDVIRYYQLEDTRAHVWIGHHRYPTKGKVWHPGGAHPFIGMNEALVHNGDFANYASISEYLSMRNITPMFLTDTEVSAQVFDLLYRTYDYPLEYVIESLAPTTERDFAKLPEAKKPIYEMLQTTHIHASPDGPWFFLIAQSDDKSGERVYRLTGITDTSMLRPQVFALQGYGPDGPMIGFAASEKQGIDAALASLEKSDKRFWSRADRYWNARGGSYTDGGAFIFSVHTAGDHAHLDCTDKFAQPVTIDVSHKPANGNAPIFMGIPSTDAEGLFHWARELIPSWGYEEMKGFLFALRASAEGDRGRSRAINALTLLIDRRYPTGVLRRSSLLSLYDASLNKLLDEIETKPSPGYVLSTGQRLWLTEARPGQVAAIDASVFTPEDETSAAREMVRLKDLGFRRFIIYRAGGHRFIGSGFGADTGNILVDVYGSSGDYLASGSDGMTIRVHNSAQDQLAQIMKSGTLVVHGDVGQTFMYGAKGGEAYVLGNAAGRPLINAVGKPRVVINGTCLDYLAESFMAGNPHDGGGFIILNGICVDDDGAITDQETPYPGGNLFSLASGGAIFVRDPHGMVTADQLNGGVFASFTPEDWSLILPYLKNNEQHFGISIEDLLLVNGERVEPEAVYRKVVPSSTRALQAEEVWAHAK